MDTEFDLIVLGGGPRRLRRGHTRRPTRHARGRRRTRAPGRHLPQLGLHPHQGAAALLRNQPPAAPSRRVRLRRRQHPLRPAGDRETLPQGRQTNWPRASATCSRKTRWPCSTAPAASPAPTSSPSLRTASRSPTSPAPHIILATGARARQLPGMESDGKLIWSYREAMGAHCNAEIPAGHRLRRHRHRIRQLLSQPRRRGHRGRSAGPRAGRSRTPKSAAWPSRHSPAKACRSSPMPP